MIQAQKEVRTSPRQHEVSAKHVEEDSDEDWTPGQRLADRMADFVGTWTFLFFGMVFVVIWMLMNFLVILRHPPDPYPFIFLNLVLSCISAIQAPIILMSQNRKEEEDRRRSQQDYRVNFKAELEIRHLNEKIGHMLPRQWERLAEIQEIQVELRADLCGERST